MLKEAFGHPGVPPTWTTGAKVGVGTAVSSTSRVWFTLANGIVTEVYYPRVDVADVKDFQFLVTDGRTFFHEEQRDLIHLIEYPSGRALAYKLTSEDPEGRYRIVKWVFTDPDEDSLVVHVSFEALKGAIEDYRLYALLAPHVKNQGHGNSGKVTLLNGGKSLLAWREDVYLCLASSLPVLRASCGFAGFSDGWTDVQEHLDMQWEFNTATDGNIALTGEIDLRAGNEFTLVLGFGSTAKDAVDTACRTLAKPWDEVWHQYVAQWEEYCAALEDLTAQAEDGGILYYVSAMVLKAHEDKTYPGAFVASLSIPWGEAVGDANAGGYHLCWPRDLVQVGSALLAMGDGQAALRALKYLARIQRDDGSWPQNCWVDGSPYWRELQLDEVAFPVILAWQLQRAGVLEKEQFDAYPTVRRAALCLARCGPVTPQERWEENSGYSPSTLAACIAALVCASEFAMLHHEERLAEYLLEVSDYWAAKVEDWTFTRCGELLAGHSEYYERIASVVPEELGRGGTECRVFLPIRNLAQTIQVSQCCIVDGGFLELVRYGVRAANDYHVLKTLPVYDALLKVDTPYGPVWRRYNHDGYGQKENGAPFDSTGVGRGWPLLTGERGHYELSRGRSAKPYVTALERLANEGGLLPEQVWDSASIPDKGLYPGEGTGAATPLCWAHAEYIKLLRSRRDKRVFDRVEDVHDRYVRGKLRSDLEIWKFNHKLRAIPSSKRLRIEVGAPAFLHWTRDNWVTVHHDPLAEVAPDTGIYALEFPEGSFSPGRALEFTFYWPETGQWEDRNFTVAAV